MHLNFRKMHGCGNDFVVIDGRKAAVNLSSEQIEAISNRRFGVGCDQLVILEDSEQADVLMQIYNADGGKVPTCGNATRCVGDLLMRETGANQVAIETMAGTLDAWRDAESGSENAVCVSMGAPRLNWRDIPLSESCDTLHLGVEDGALKDPVAVSMGNPHMVFFVPDFSKIDLESSGTRLERHPLFPEGVNVSVVQVKSPSHLVVKTFERGAGQTLACGSAACATVVSGVLRGLCGEKACVEMPGGSLNIHWRKDEAGDVLMSGAVSYVFEGEIGI